MEVLVVKNNDVIAQKLADIIIAQIQEKSDSVFGFCCGKMPSLSYQYLIKKIKEKGIDCSKITLFIINELFCTQECVRKSEEINEIVEHLVTELNIDPENTYVFVESKINPEVDVNETTIKQNDLIDLLVLRIGDDVDNESYLEELINKEQGIANVHLGTLMITKKIVLIAAGSHKAKIIRNLIEAPAKENTPALFLKKHPNFKMIIDTEAASEISAKQKAKAPS